MRISDWSSDVCSSDLKAGISPVVSSQDEGPEYRVEDIEDTVGHPPCAVRDAIGGFFRKRRHQNEQKRRPCRERTPGRDPCEKQDEHASMTQTQTVRGGRAHAARGAQWAGKIAYPFQIGRAQCSE